MENNVLTALETSVDDETVRDPNQLVDWDTRSWCSQEAGYQSSGAVSDGAKEYHHMSSVRSVGSVGSQEESDRYGGGFSYRATRAVQHLINGETRFPTAMSYLSDAQRSDVATVCSGSSIVEDIEVESVLSQEEQTSATIDKSIRRTSSHRVVEFAGVHLAAVLPFSGASLQALNSQQQELHQDGTLLPHDMGPPLTVSRSLLLQKSEGLALQGTTCSVKSYESNPGSDNPALCHLDDCGGSLDVETQSNFSQEDHGELIDHEGLSNPQQQATRESSLSNELKNFDSQKSNGAGISHCQCSASTDIESHSSGLDEGAVHAQVSRLASVNQTHNNFLIADTMANGRRSPGGTIYKGRGIRRYQGRSMHLPLRRFHQDGVHIDSVRNDSFLQQESNHDSPSLHHFSPDKKRVANSKRSRSRSRSRSPTSQNPRVKPEDPRVNDYPNYRMSHRR